jgi:hypothetical protein
MSKLVPLREVTHLRLLPPSDEDGICGRSWWPVSCTELHLASLYFPLAVRIDGGVPSLGLLLGEAHLKRSAVDVAGKWQGGYKPIALRSAPFACAEAGCDALDLLIGVPSRHLVERGGIPILDAAGAVHPLLGEIHRWCRLLQDSRARLADALDRLLMADLLVPLISMDRTPTDDASLYIVDAARFMDADKKAFAAMARHEFTALDVAVASLSSQRLLQERYRPTSDAKPKPYPSSSSLPHDAIAIDGVDLALDDGELIMLADIDALQRVPCP